MRLLRGVIFDVDGTLVDSNDAHARAWTDALASFGIVVEFARVRRCIGMGGDKLLPALASLREDEPRGHAISEARREIFLHEYLPRVRAMPGARELVQRVRDAGYVTLVASSSKPDELVPLLTLVGAEDLVHAATSAEDADRSKPAPDVVHAALARGHLEARDAVMVGDTPYDIAAATRAGVPPIGFRCGGWDDLSLRGAIEYYAGPADLLSHWDRSVLGRRHL